MSKKSKASVKGFEVVLPPAKAFKVFRISANTNDFGLHGHWLMAQDGETWEMAKYRFPGSTDGNWQLGQIVMVQPASSGIIGSWNWSGLGVEIPERKLPDPPPEIIAEVWKIGWPQSSETRPSGRRRKSEHA